jgi:dienelactone hydrolase
MARIVVAVLAVAMIALAVWRLEGAAAGVRVEAVAFGSVPGRVYHPQVAMGPVLVISHGFAGSQQIMQSFAFSAARAGYVAVTYDSAGHGRNPVPLSGSVVEVSGATATLVRELTAVAEAARGLGDGRLAVLGHSMATDIVVRFAKATEGVEAVVAVSMFSPEVTAEAPRNLLMITGEWEGMLTAEALRVVRLVAPGAVAGETHGTAGNLRRAAVAPHVEHASVLFSTVAMAETIGWLDRVFGVERAAPPVADRGGWILLLLAAGVTLGWPMAALLPPLAERPTGAGLRGRRLWIVALAPMLAVPLVLRVVPTGFLPVLVADYLAVHFLAYGLATALALWAVGARLPAVTGRGLAAGAGAAGFVALALFWPVDRYLTNFWPGPGRGVIIAAMAVGTFVYFWTLDWAGRGMGAGRGAYLLLKLCFVLSLALAVVLDFERLFFLLIILPIVVVFFLVFGLLGLWVERRTLHPLPGAVMAGFAFAWALGVTFPMLSAG